MPNIKIPLTVGVDLYSDSEEFGEKRCIIADNGDFSHPGEVALRGIRSGISLESYVH